MGPTRAGERAKLGPGPSHVASGGRLRLRKEEVEELGRTAGGFGLKDI